MLVRRVTNLDSADNMSYSTGASGTYGSSSLFEILKQGVDDAGNLQ